MTAEANPTVVEEQVRSERATFRVVRIAKDLAYPWSIAFLPDNSALISERPGALLRLNIQTNKLHPVTGVPRVVAVGQGGFLDIEPHPQFSQNRLIYMSYTIGDIGYYATRIARGRLTNNNLKDIEVLLTMNQPSAGVLHFGSRLAFGSDGMLYATFGERGERHRAQDPADHAGTIIRLLDDGSTPIDNPFASGGGAPEVYSFGHRNPQGLAVHPVTGLLWSHEHGPQGGDEVNVISSNVNYGWPVITYGVEYRSGSLIGVGTEAPGMAQPVLHWTPSIAPSGMTFYSGDQFPGWQGNLFVGALAGQHLRRVQIEDEQAISEEVLLYRRVGRVRDVKQGPHGMLWLLEDARRASIYRLEPAS